jgi:hypothetical protein
MIPRQETIEEAGFRLYPKFISDPYNPSEDLNKEDRDNFIEGAKWNQEQILQFLYSEITERRPYSSSKMCEKVIEFIEQLNTQK